MGREEILETVRQMVVETLTEFDGARVTDGSTFKDLGVGSLQFVEIVSKCQRAMKVKIPRSELPKMKDIGALVDALARAPAK